MHLSIICADVAWLHMPHVQMYQYAVPQSGAMEEEEAINLYKSLSTLIVCTCKKKVYSIAATAAVRYL